MHLPDELHCDGVIDDATAHPALRAFVAYERQPSVKKDPRNRPRLFATYNGQRCRVVMASRFGDVGIRLTELSEEYGYTVRCAVAELQNFSDTI